MEYPVEKVLSYPLLALLVLAVFYGIYFVKMLAQKRRGIRTLQFRRRKEKSIQTDGTVTEFTVTAPLDGAYAIVVVGQKAKGNIHIDVERVTRGEGEMEKGGEDEIEASYPGADAVEFLNHCWDTTTVYKSAGGTNIPFYL